MLWIGGVLLLIAFILRTYGAYHQFKSSMFEIPYILSSPSRKLVFAAIWLAFLAVSEVIFFIRGGWVWGVGGLIFIFIVGPNLLAPIILRILHRFWFV